MQPRDLFRRPTKNCLWRLGAVIDFQDTDGIFHLALREQKYQVFSGTKSKYYNHPFKINTPDMELVIRKMYVCQFGICCARVLSNSYQEKTWSYMRGRFPSLDSFASMVATREIGDSVLDSVYRPSTLPKSELIWQSPCGPSTILRLQFFRK